METDLAPHQHGAEHHLQAIKEVVTDEDDGGASSGPALAWTDGFDAGRSCFGNTKEGGQSEPTQVNRGAAAQWVELKITEVIRYL